MLGFLIRGIAVKRARRLIERLDPAVSVHVPEELPLPSIRVVTRMAAVVSRINALETGLQALSDDDLRARTQDFRKRYQEAVAAKRTLLEEIEGKYRSAVSGDERETLVLQLEEAEKGFKDAKRATLTAILPEAFAVVREASRRILGMRHYDIQLVGGMVLHEGGISEMATGEGKTLVSTAPVYLNALTGEGVHIVTVNDYLARRDREWMGPLYEFLGLSVGVIVHGLTTAQRQEAYRCDITYGTNNEFGFDYLRDNMVSYRDEMVQRGHYYAVVDEVDSILIDEARTPLIISGPAEESTDTYYKAEQIARTLQGIRLTENDEIEAKYRGEEIEDITRGYDYSADEKGRAVSLTDQGEERCARGFGIPNMHDMETMEYRHHILQALRAKEFFKRDVDYVVRDGEVIIVDEFTGRMMPGRRWSDGLHQAIEAKEGIKIERENQTLATVTFQNYFRMYEKLAGMTGTAYTEAGEFKEIYHLDTVVLPTNRPLKRKNFDDCIYRTAREKYQAVVDEIVEYHRRGQPVLVGTISIEKSELISDLLKQRGISHQVLNAKYHEREAQIVAQAGRYQGVTIATNMAGRGTDIVLGGNAEFLARSLADEQRAEDETDADHEGRIAAFLAQFRDQVRREHAQVVEAGGLHVIGTERHESRRIDNQLRGRSGRQGDPGSSKFFISLEDDLMRLFGGDRLMAIMATLGAEEGQTLEHPLISRSIGIAQKRVEGFNFEIRKQLIEYDNVMNKQREAVYSLRRSILESSSVQDRVREVIDEVAARAAERYLYGGLTATEWDWDGLFLYMKSRLGCDLTNIRERLMEKPYAEIVTDLRGFVRQVYEAREAVIGAETLRHLEKMIFLNTIDTKWKEHLYAMDQLKGGVGLRAYGQRDPVLEYKREGFEMFQAMFDVMYEEVAELVLRMAVPEQPPRFRGVFESVPQHFVHRDFSSLEAASDQAAAGAAPLARALPESSVGAASSEARTPVHHQEKKVGRNDPCPCGSGKKYKKCCGA